MDEDKLQNDTYRAAQAKALMENPLLVEAFEYLDQAYVAAWRVCKDPQLREVGWHRVNIIPQVKDHLATVLNNGILAEHQIRELVARQAGRPRKAA